ncbi:hypothetical protein HHK36_007012 [Tetracentron sinense]|uniref:Single-stranded DNA-binding protein n=1 Tax=Tetracentron sinense TaxID=13715 RepID=A0A834ZII1_TETSI|nr:hypothetical protein HHK36_007012 [Tetracentron sinense]
MACSMASMSRRLSRSILSTTRRSQISMSYCTNITSSEDSDSEDSKIDSDRNSVSPPSSSDSNQQQNFVNQQQNFVQRPLENGLDAGVYKAILVGVVGQSPVVKNLRSGRTVTIFSLGTGGIRNNRRPLDHEEPREYANRCAVQWHRVSVYPDRLGRVVTKNATPGVLDDTDHLHDYLSYQHRHERNSILYLEGNLETKVFSDPITGLVRRIREIAIRRDGRVVFLGRDGDARQSTQSELRGVGYY